MNKHFTYLALMLSVLALLGTTARAQQPVAVASPKTTNDGPIAETPDRMGDYLVVSSLEFGYRGIAVDGDQNKFQSDLNYKAGPRLFDSSFLMRSKEGNGGLFDTLL